ncbi:hypothetical protein [Rickettsia endosymbiont of Orchestes rusci]|uniref:hypothetical protein n=1 Tax=Rickettsia endosymbiont of Orchestes rusci TaxID=3066250 RepID=UPI00313EAE21
MSRSLLIKNMLSSLRGYPKRHSSDQSQSRLIIYTYKVKSSKKYEVKEIILYL